VCIQSIPFAALAQKESLSLMLSEKAVRYSGDGRRDERERV
jgi:hypothetical protein